MLESDLFALNSSELEKQSNSLHRAIEMLDEALQNEFESSKIHNLQSEIATKRQMLSSLKDQLHEGLTENESIRRSIRPRNPTERMLAYKKEETQKKEAKLLSVHNQWKMHAHNAREQLKVDIPDSHLANLIDILEEAKDKVMNVYYGISQHATPSTDIRRRVDM